MKEAILQTPELATPQQVREFLGTIGYRSWDLLKRPGHYMKEVEKNKNWTWTEPMKRAFQELR